MDARLEPVREPRDPTKVYKQVKKDANKSQEVSRYPDAVKRIVVGKIVGIYSATATTALTMVSYIYAAPVSLLLLQ